jgi:hypothetical protein
MSIPNGRAIIAERLRAILIDSNSSSHFFNGFVCFPNASVARFVPCVGLFCGKLPIFTKPGNAGNDLKVT